MQKKNSLANIIGLSTLAVPTIAMVILVPADIFPWPLLFFVFAMWVAAAVFVWEKIDKGWSINEKWRIDGEWKRWFILAAWSIVGAGLFYAFAKAVAFMFFGKEEPELSKGIDIFIAVMISPGITFIAIAGGIRDFVQKHVREPRTGGD